MFFEVGEKVGDAAFLRYFAAALIDERAVLVGADGEGSREEIGMDFGSFLSGGTQAESDASAAAFATFGAFFQTFSELEERFGIIHSLDDWDIKLHFGHKSFEFCGTVKVLFFGSDIGIEEKEGDIEILMEIFKCIAAAWSAAGVEEKRRFFARITEL